MSSKIYKDGSVEIFEISAEGGGQLDFTAQRGDVLHIGIEFAGEIYADLRDVETDEELPSNRSADATRPEGDRHGGFFARVYQIARSGVYRLSFGATSATATVARFAAEIGNALIHQGPPNRTTCFICSKTVSLVTKSVLATHGIWIPALELELDDLEMVRDILMPFDIDNAATFFEEAAQWVPHSIADRIERPLGQVFDILARRFADAINDNIIPDILRDPVMWAAKRGCRLLNLCAA